MHERLPIIMALPIFASDALSSVAYATEAILHQFAGMRLAHDQYRAALFISIAIIALIAMVAVSYRQVIFAYPHGGGSYVVARENLGLFIGLVAAAALLVDYVLTVAVSIADGVQHSFSIYGQFGGSAERIEQYKLLVAVLVVFLVTLANLRGVRESGALFAGPPYVFICLIFAMIGFGIWRLLFGGGAAEHVAMVVKPQDVASLDVMKLLRGFASGCAALTGIEAVSNGVQAFRKPEAPNASKTLMILAAILAVMFIGITYLAVQFQVGPRETETVISQIARASFGTKMPLGILYIGVQVFTSFILFLAANTAFAGFPRLASILAEDGFLPRQLAALGDRLAYNNGIIVLSLFAIGFLVVFHGEAHALLPLYTIGVFIAFSTAQAGMVRRSWGMRPRPWDRIAINAVGAVVTTIVFGVVTVSKFIVTDQPALFGTTWLREGAWMALVLMGLIVWHFYAIHAHYRHVDAQLAAIPPEAHRAIKHTVIVLVPSRIHKGIVQALNYACSISPDALGVHVAFDRSKEPQLREQWEKYAGDVPLIILESPYRSLIGPLMDYLDAAEKVRSDDIITVILPEFVPSRWWHNFLHNASGWLLRLRLFFRRDVVITSVRYYLD